jgi:hypothetical protein
MSQKTGLYPVLDIVPLSSVEYASKENRGDVHLPFYYVTTHFIPGTGEGTGWFVQAESPHTLATKIRNSELKAIFIKLPAYILQEMEQCKLMVTLLCTYGLLSYVNLRGENFTMTTTAQIAALEQPNWEAITLATINDPIMTAYALQGTVARLKRSMVFINNESRVFYLPLLMAYYNDCKEEEIRPFDYANILQTPGRALPPDKTTDPQLDHLDRLLALLSDGVIDLQILLYLHEMASTEVAFWRETDLPVHAPTSILEQFKDVLDLEDLLKQLKTKAPLQEALKNLLVIFQDLDDENKVLWKPSSHMHPSGFTPPGCSTLLLVSLLHRGPSVSSNHPEAASSSPCRFTMQTSTGKLKGSSNTAEFQLTLLLLLQLVHGFFSKAAVSAIEAMGSLAKKAEIDRLFPSFDSEMDSKTKKLLETTKKAVGVFFDAKKAKKSSTREEIEKSLLKLNPSWQR